ncbi:hypothetical protein PIB30_090992 [Stylosanthes scabra]|uniref:Uncharacterized protein n=1 Tax=Stylosanthes scabra TaxID=79078 RepID=A0ABU6RUX7_9FABA|nr:hypothetical protein [Stylosanthes scabra]
MLDGKTLTPESEVSEEQRENEDHNVINFGKICYLFPIRGNILHEFFHDDSSHASISTKVPPSSNLCGFIFYLVLSKPQSSNIDELIINFECECYLETSWGESIHTTISAMVEWDCDMTEGYQLNVMPNHVLLWYDEECSKQIMETVKGREAISEKLFHFNEKMTVKFVARLPNKEEAMVKSVASDGYIQMLRKDHQRSRDPRESWKTVLKNTSNLSSSKPPIIDCDFAFCLFTEIDVCRC